MYYKCFISTRFSKENIVCILFLSICNVSIPCLYLSSVIWKSEDEIMSSALPCYIGVCFTFTYFLQLIKVISRIWTVFSNIESSFPITLMMKRLSVQIFRNSCASLNRSLPTNLVQPQHVWLFCSFYSRCTCSEIWLQYRISWLSIFCDSFFSHYRLSGFKQFAHSLVQISKYAKSLSSD